VQQCSKSCLLGAPWTTSCGMFCLFFLFGLPRTRFPGIRGSPRRDPPGSIPGDPQNAPKSVLPPSEAQKPIYRTSCGLFCPVFFRPPKIRISLDPGVSAQGPPRKHPRGLPGCSQMGPPPSKAQKQFYRTSCGLFCQGFCFGGLQLLFRKMVLKRITVL
jgi:hypothetical protein